MEKDLHAACTQLITEADLQLDADVVKKLENESCAALIGGGETPYIKLFSHTPMPLSDVLPIITDYGIRVLSEVSFLVHSGQKEIYTVKFTLDLDDARLLEAHRERITESLLKVLQEESFMSCSLFQLIYRENFSVRDIELFRAIQHYESQLIAEFGIDHIGSTLVKYHGISKQLLTFFEKRFTPMLKRREQMAASIRTALSEAFKEVERSDEDRILKLFFNIIEQMQRCNYYLEKPTIAFKVDTNALKPDLSGLQPNSEIYVYGDGFRGVHLRMDLVSRGGLRYSNRSDDYRREIKALMGAQEGKNAVIVPSGAKGGFVIDKAGSALDPDTFRICYTEFVEALLDMVDNKEHGKMVHDRRIVAYDGADSYFVVAADRGTSSMSDIANAIAIRRAFWIGDAFASGGSKGFHHKKLGVTAKGALRSTQRFFIEKGVDFYKESITVVGIGSMSGDVFGNGMLESDTFRLLGAISHDEVFIDPDPDPKSSYRERKRLFEAGHAKWSDYDRGLLSKGGGVFRREEREIEISDEIAALLHTKRRHLSGEMLAHMLLRLPVDLLYNGGIGTYVKSSMESNIAVGDKENEYVRIDAEELRAVAVCEGGNLGFTQAARMEYAKNGGLINLDSIDNAAGVNTSDHEVNFKIIFNTLVQKGLLSEEEKEMQIKALSPHVVDRVLQDNYLQSLALSLDQVRSRKFPNEFIRVTEILEQHLEVFERRYFMIPSGSEFGEIVDDNGKLLRPALSALLLYAKIFLKRFLLENGLKKKEDFTEKYLLAYFPRQFASLYEEEILSHPLRREIIAMMIANTIINQSGALFIVDYEELGSEKFLQKIRSYLITDQLFDAGEARAALYRNDYLLDPAMQYRLLIKIEEEISYNLTWMLKSLQSDEAAFSPILNYKESIKEVIEGMEIPYTEVVPGERSLNLFFTHLNLLKFATAILKITRNSNYTFSEAAAVFYRIVHTFDITLLIDKAERVVLNTSNDAMLRVQLQQLIEFLVVDLTREILQYRRGGEEIDGVLKQYLETKSFNFQHYEKMLEYLRTHEQISLSDLSITVNYLLFIKS